MATKTKKTQVATKAIDELIEVTAIERQSAKRIKELRDDAKKGAPVKEKEAKRKK